MLEVSGDLPEDVARIENYSILGRVKGELDGIHGAKLELELNVLDITPVVVDAGELQIVDVLYDVWEHVVSDVLQ